VAARGLLGVDQVAVQDHLEDAAGGRDQLGVQIELVLELGRQTGGDGLVVSDLAVFDGELHAGSS